MQADFSRFRFNLNKGYNRVLQQQGRVTLDADWNEQVSIQADLDRKRLQDVVGSFGVPCGDAGFHLSIVDESPTDYDLNIEAGTIYVAGHRIELYAPVKYTDQPFLSILPAIDKLKEDSWVDLVYLCVRERHVTYLEDETIREIALGGPDTSTRVQTIWQVCVEKSLEAGGDDFGFCMKTGVGAGLLTTIETKTDSADPDPCVTTVNSGYRGLENRLYRVEVHEGGTVEDGASIKWSRYNGAVVFKVLEINTKNRILTLARLGWDQVITLSPGCWIELLSEEDEQTDRPGAMLQVSSEAGAVNDAQRQVTLKSTNGVEGILNIYEEILNTCDKTKNNVKVRLWESEAIKLNGKLVPDNNAIEITLGDGVDIKIAVSNPRNVFRSGDYWTFTARAVPGLPGQIEKLSDAPPQGHQWHCCKLALIRWKRNEKGDATYTIVDCRPLFPSLTEMLQLHYVGGDGQEGMPDQKLPGDLVVRVSRGEHPAANIPIIYEIETHDLEGRVFTKSDLGGDRIVVNTDPDGFATCWWQLGKERTCDLQRVRAFIEAPGFVRLHQQVTFNANLRIAENVSYRPKKTCINIDNSVDTVAGALDALCSIDAEGIYYNPSKDCSNLEGKTTVAEALDALCDDPAFHVVGVFWQVIKEDLQIAVFHENADLKNAINDETISIYQLGGGLRIECDSEPEPKTITQASVFMTLELPIPTLHGVRMSYILEGDLTVKNKNIFWLPTPQALCFLIEDIYNVVEHEGVFLARLFLKGSKIWRRDNPNIHLDGDVINLPVNDKTSPHGLLLPSGDGEQGGTFEMWFNLHILKGFYIVGVLNPEGLFGHASTITSHGDVIIIKDREVIADRLNALDIGYDHSHAIKQAEIDNYSSTQTSFDKNKACDALSKNGFPIHNADTLVTRKPFEFKVVAVRNTKCTDLAKTICDKWNKTFKMNGINFFLEAKSAEEIPNSLNDASIVICNERILGTLLCNTKVGEPSGMVRRPFFKRV